MSWTLLPWPPLRTPWKDAARCVLGEPQESLSSRLSFKKADEEKLQEKKVAVLPGLITGITVEAKEVALTSDSKERVEERASGPKENHITTMGASASLQASEYLSSTQSNEKIEMVTCDPQAPMSILEIGTSKTDVSEAVAELATQPTEVAGTLVDDERDDTSYTLDEEEDTTTPDNVENASADEDASRKEASESASSSSESSEEWGQPPLTARPWLRFATLVSDMEPWNARAWHGLDSPLVFFGGFSSFFTTPNRLRFSFFYASAMLRSYRRKFVRRITGWSFIPSCPKRPHHRSLASESQDL
jgi:hypothetical protein